MKAKFTLSLLLTTIVATPAFSQYAPPQGDIDVNYSPFSEKTFPNSVFFGDTHLHRNILFSDNKDKADQIIPISSFDTTDPEKLWAWMENYWPFHTMEIYPMA